MENLEILGLASEEWPLPESEFLMEHFVWHYCVETTTVSPRTMSR